MDSECSSTILIGRLVEKIHPAKDYVIHWQTQAGNIHTNIKVEVDFTLPELSATNVVTGKFFVNDSYKGRYDMIV